MMHILRIPICAAHCKNLILKPHSTLFISPVTAFHGRSHPKRNLIRRFLYSAKLLSHTHPLPNSKKRLLDIPKMAASNSSLFTGKLECFYKIFLIRETFLCMSYSISYFGSQKCVTVAYYSFIRLLGVKCCIFRIIAPLSTHKLTTKEEC